MKSFILLFFCSLPLVLFAQKNIPIKNLVFEGSGIRGIAFCGSIIELEERHMLSDLEKVGGSSAGAITALTLALGYTGKEIQDIITKTDFKKFNDGRYFLVGGINRTNKYFGWYRGTRFIKWLEKLIENKTGDPDISFEGLSKKGYKDLYITGTCLNKQKLVVFSKDNYPNMKIKDAIRVSMSIPLYFEAVFLDSAGNIVPHPKNKNGLDVMVDGGLIANFPIRLFDSLQKRNPATLGLRIDSDQQIKNDQQNRELTSLQINKLRQYLSAFYYIVFENLNRQLLSEEDWSRTISISDGKLGSRLRRLSNAEVNTLITNGRKAIQNHFK